jgi:hypothetical protein
MEAMKYTPRKQCLEQSTLSPSLLNMLDCSKLNHQVQKYSHHCPAIMVPPHQLKAVLNVILARGMHLGLLCVSSS